MPEFCWVKGIIRYITWAVYIRLMDLLKQHFGVLELHTNLFGELKTKYYGEVFVSGAFSGKCVLPEGLAKELPQITKSFRSWAIIDCTMVLPIFKCSLDSKNTPGDFEHTPDLL